MIETVNGNGNCAIYHFLWSLLTGS